mmetsp:Transcript_13814/g.43141  ORF Transcript_13814/g.43141 Transcript_13814/m.43141 type:complete len:250 (+) Transcript_13814:502-1251(+)
MTTRCRLSRPRGKQQCTMGSALQAGQTKRYLGEAASTLLRTRRTSSFSKASWRHLRVCLRRTTAAFACAVAGIVGWALQAWRYRSKFNLLSRKPSGSSRTSACSAASNTGSAASACSWRCWCHFSALSSSPLSSTHGRPSCNLPPAPLRGSSSSSGRALLAAALLLFDKRAAVAQASDAMMSTMPRTAVLLPPAQATDAGAPPTAAVNSVAQAKAATHFVLVSAPPLPSSNSGADGASTFSSGLFNCGL